MKFLLFLVVVFFSVSSLATDVAFGDSFKQELKQKLRFELNVLEVSMMLANNEIAQLREDKAHIDTDLRNMEEWGKQQEQQKNAYYTGVIELTNNLSVTQAQVDLEKEKGKTTLTRYHRVKSILGYIFGLLLAFLYSYLGMQVISSFATVFAAPWAVILRFAGPAIAFGVGYTVVNIFF